MQIGDHILYLGRAYVVRGVSPMSVSPSVVHLADAESGEQLEVPVEQLESAAKEDGA